MRERQRRTPKRKPKPEKGAHKTKAAKKTQTEKGNQKPRRKNRKKRKGAKAMGFKGKPKGRDATRVGRADVDGCLELNCDLPRLPSGCFQLLFAGFWVKCMETKNKQNKKQQPLAIQVPFLAAHFPSAVNTRYEELGVNFFAPKLRGGMNEEMCCRRATQHEDPSTLKNKWDTVAGFKRHERSPALANCFILWKTSDSLLQLSKFCTEALGTSE